MIDQDEAQELRQQAAADLRRDRQHAAHPDLRDPDYCAPSPAVADERKPATVAQAVAVANRAIDTVSSCKA